MDEDFEFLDGILAAGAGGTGGGGGGGTGGGTEADASGVPPSETSSSSSILNFSSNNLATPGSAMMTGDGGPTPSPPAIISSHFSMPMPSRRSQERFDLRIARAELDADAKEQEELVPAPYARALVLQYRVLPTSAYVTRKSVFYPVRGGGEEAATSRTTYYFQSPNVRHLCHHRLKRSSEELAKATAMAMQGWDAERQAKRAKQGKSGTATMLTAALHNTRRILFAKDALV